MEFNRGRKNDSKYRIFTIGVSSEAISRHISRIHALALSNLKTKVDLPRRVNDEKGQKTRTVPE